MKLTIQDYKDLREIGEALNPFEINPIKAVDNIFLNDADILTQNDVDVIKSLYDDVKKKCKKYKPYNQARKELVEFSEEIYKEFKVNKETKNLVNMFLDILKSENDICVDLGKYVVLVAVMKGVSKSSLPTKTFAKASFVFLYNVRKLSYRYIEKATKWVLKRIGLENEHF